MNVTGLQTHDFLMKKGVYWMPVNALGFAYGGAGGI
jgi:hypothetical protein